MGKDNILEVNDLHTYFYSDDAVIKAVEGTTFSVRENEMLGLVGESACGKTITAYSIMGLISSPGKIVQGQVVFEGKDLLKGSLSDMQKVRGSEIAMIFQEPSAALNPLYTIRFQIEEMLKVHKKELNRIQRRRRIEELLEKVGISQAKLRVKDYPHNLSGGQAQRVMIAMALSCSPSLLIADEPATALDVTIQAQVLDLLLQIKSQEKLSGILITHDLSFCAQLVDRIAIMYAGRIVELASTEELIKNPLHPYTKALFGSIPQTDRTVDRLQTIEGVVPDPSGKPRGCYFNPRCNFVQEICRSQYPRCIEVKKDHWVSCFAI